MMFEKSLRESSIGHQEESIVFEIAIGIVHQHLSFLLSWQVLKTRTGNDNISAFLLLSREEMEHIITDKGLLRSIFLGIGEQSFSQIYSTILKISRILLSKMAQKSPSTTAKLEDSRFGEMERLDSREEILKIWPRLLAGLIVLFGLFGIKGCKVSFYIF